jgi:hypothetical protein
MRRRTRLLRAPALVLALALSAAAIAVALPTLAHAPPAGAQTPPAGAQSPPAGAQGAPAGAPGEAATQPSPLAVGIGEQHPWMFGDARFRALGIRYARISVSWDVLAHAKQRNTLFAWLRGAHLDGVAPLVAFERSWIPGHFRRLPAAARLAGTVRSLRARYPWLTDFATWNEANYCGQPTCRRPGLVAAYYTRLRAACHSCHILGAELLDVPGMVQWVARERRAIGREPEIWGLHNYIGANRLSAASTNALLAATHGQVWFTETGGVVARHGHHPDGFPETPAHAARVTRFVFQRLVPLSPRIKRVYLYQWGAGTGRREPWDSGLLDARDKPRPAFWVLVQELHLLGQLPLTPAATALLARAAHAGA